MAALELQVKRGHKAGQDQVAQLDNRVQKAIREALVPRDPLEIEVNLVRLDLQAEMEKLDQLDQ